MEQQEDLVDEVVEVMAAKMAKAALEVEVEAVE